MKRKLFLPLLNCSLIIYKFAIRVVSARIVQFLWISQVQSKHNPSWKFERAYQVTRNNRWEKKCSYWLDMIHYFFLLKNKLIVHLFFINNNKFKQLPRKSLICYTIPKQFAVANKRQKLNNALREQAQTARSIPRNHLKRRKSRKWRKTSQKSPKT